MTKKEFLRIHWSIMMVAKAKLINVKDQKTVAEKLALCKEVIADIELAEKLRKECGR